VRRIVMNAESSKVTWDTPRVPSASERFALRVIQFGTIAVVLVASTLTTFDLDRFLVPKELVLHLTAVVAGLLTMRAFMRGSATRTDLFLTGFLLLGVLSAAMATNRWLGFRALSISASGIILFWTARGLRDAGLARPLLGGLTLAVVVAAATSLLQSYGLETALFADTRVPGGTLGNRNFIAHVDAVGLPLLLLAAALGARSRRGFTLGSIGVVIVTASLVLTRSRAAWLAVGAVVAVLFVAMLLSPPLRRDGRTWRRLAGMVLLAGCGVGMAIGLPNALRWRSHNPYLESVRHVADYQQGSGRGRLVQYERSLRMAARHPLFGVGPGNWPVAYPANAAPNDPSLNDAEPGTTFNPWPSSDVVAWLAERGLPALICLALAFLGLAAGGFRNLGSAGDADEGLLAAVLLGIIAAAVVAGLFDAVLLLPAPALLFWTAAGALWSPEGSRPVSRSIASIAFIAAVVISGLGAYRSAVQLIVMEIYATDGNRASLARASRLDPGSYRLHLRLARSGRHNERCQHALAARALFPSARAAIEASRGCGP
jgi:O-antigen ligase